MKKDETEDQEETFNEDIPLDISGDEQPIGLDSEDSSELDIGAEVAEPKDANADDDGTLEWDFEGLIAATTGASALDDDSAGPPQFDPAIGVHEFQTGDLDDAVLGFASGEPLLETTFHDAGSRDDDDQALFNDFELDLVEERPIQNASHPWRLVASQEGCFESILLVGNLTLIAGDDLLILDETIQRRVALPSSIIDMRRFGKPPHRVAARTRSGRLLVMDAPHYSQLSTLEAAQELNAERITRPEMASFELPDGEAQLVMRGPGGTLHLLNPNSGALQRTSLDAKILLLPSEADRPLCITKQGNNVLVSSAENAGDTWHSVPAPANVAQQLEASGTILLAHDDTVVLGNPRCGVLLSQDRGKSFRTLPGSFAVTGLAAGSYRGSLQLWLAMSRELESKVDLVQLDLSSLELTRLAQFDAMAEEEFAPAQALAWAPEAETLYVVGEFGLRTFSSP